MTVNARCEDDLDPDAVKDKVKKSSGANFSYHKEKPRPEPANKPVVSNSDTIYITFQLLLGSKIIFFAAKRPEEGCVVLRVLEEPRSMPCVWSYHIYALQALFRKWTWV